MSDLMFLTREYLPLYYTDHEGGGFRPWYRGPVTEAALLNRDCRTVVINDRTVHSLAFSDPTVRYDGREFHRWDCVNGWTVHPDDMTIDDAYMASGMPVAA